MGNSSRKKRLIGDRGYCRSARTKDPALCVGCRKQAVIRVAGSQLREQCRTGLGLAQFDRLQLGDRQLQLSSTLAQFADFCSKLLNSVHDTFPNYLPSFRAQLALVPGVDGDHRENSEDDEQQ